MAIWIPHVICIFLLHNVFTYILLFFHYVMYFSMTSYRLFPHPHPNNALEATNRVIKDEDTIREQIPLSRFTVVVFSIVNKWSKERNPIRINSKRFEHQSLITLSHWTDGYNWVKLNKEVISVPVGDTTIY